MKTPNPAYAAKQKNAAEVSAQRVEIIDFIGQALANEYNTPIGTFPKPNLVFNVNGQQFAVTVQAREKAISLSEASDTFNPDPVDEA